MRVAFVLAVLFAFSNAARAQEQEGKLVDRLLRPNTELQNDAQTKKFTSSKIVEGKPANVGSFYVQDRQLAKNFVGARSVTTRTAFSNAFHPPKSGAYLGSRNALQLGNFDTRASQLPRPIHDANKTAEQREFSTRKFEARGKSQKAISAQNRAMTIDEVRELLNKSK